MKLLLLQNMLYVPTFGGANKANRLLWEGLAQRGHQCQVIAPALGSHGARSLSEFARELAARQITVHSQSPDACVYYYCGVEVHAVLNSDRLHRYVLKQAGLFKPDEIIVSSQDPGQLLLAAGLESGLAPVIYLVHCVMDLPFGPHATFKSSVTARLIGQVNGIITVSAFLKDYLARWGGRESLVLRFPVYGSGPFNQLGSFEREFVTFINPCTYKGIPIFLKLLELFPRVKFSALPAWGTTEADHARLKAAPNVTLLEPADDIETILTRTRVLLMPSLLPEAFGILAVEAMLRGIPVVASNAGGLAEAKLGIDYILPVRPIESYEEDFDSRRSRVPIVPEQDIAPWQNALHALLTRRPQFEAISQASRTAALRFVSGINIADFENVFQKISRSSRVDAPVRTREDQRGDIVAGRQNLNLNNLSEEKRTLLALRALKAKKADTVHPTDGSQPAR